MKVWDVSIIETEVERFYDSELSEFVDAIQQNITVHDMSLICKNQYEKLCFEVYYVKFFFCLSGESGVRTWTPAYNISGSHQLS